MNNGEPFDLAQGRLIMENELMNDLYWFPIVIVVALGFMGYRILRLIRRKTGLSPLHAKQYTQRLEEAAAISDVHRSILEGDKVIDHALRELGFTGSFADKMKKAQPRFSDKDAVWNAHKLRNRIAHEHDVRVSNDQKRAAFTAYRNALRDLS